MLIYILGYIGCGLGIGDVVKTTGLTNEDIEKYLELWALLHQASDAVAKLSRRKMREIGLSMTHVQLLFIVRGIRLRILRVSNHQFMAS